MCVCVCVLSHSVVSDSLRPLGRSQPGSSLHAILQARLLEWVAIPFSRGSSWPGDWTHVFCVSCAVGRFFTCWATVTLCDILFKKGLQRRSVLGVHWKDWCWSRNSNILPPDAKTWLIWKDLDFGKDWGQEEKGRIEYEMVRWHHQLNGHEFG